MTGFIEYLPQSRWH